jgi:hypothetical protein
MESKTPASISDRFHFPEFVDICFRCYISIGNIFSHWFAKTEDHSLLAKVVMLLSFPDKNTLVFLISQCYAKM